MHPYKSCLYKLSVHSVLCGNEEMMQIYICVPTRIKIRILKVVPVFSGNGAILTYTLPNLGMVVHNDTQIWDFFSFLVFQYLEFWYVIWIFSRSCFAFLMCNMDMEWIIVHWIVYCIDLIGIYCLIIQSTIGVNYFYHKE